MKIRLLVTGAAGFLGQATVRQAVSAGLYVTATDQSKLAPLFDVSYISADILDSASLINVFKGVDSVCHVAGLAHIFNKSETLRASFYSVNIEGTKNVALASVAAGVKHFVFISSVSVYGSESHGKSEDSACFPKGAYAESKLQAENYAIQIAHESGMNLTILRLATLYGEGDPGNVARLIRAVDQNRFIWIGKGENLKSLFHREDAARACMAVIQAPASGINIYNVSAPPSKMHDVVSAITCALGKSVPSWHIPASFALNSAKIIKNISLNRGWFSTLHSTMQKWLADDYYNTDKFCKTFNYQTKVSLEEGIRREVGWYRANLLE